MGPIRGLLSSLGVTEQQWRVLRVLQESGPTEPTRIAEQACLLLPSLTRILQKLEDKQYIKRRPDKSDRRKQIVQITAKGTALIEAHLEQHLDLLENVRQQIGPKKYDMLLDLLSELNGEDRTG